MGSRGPKPGSGDVSAWVGQALALGPKSAYEIQLGSTFERIEIREVIKRWREVGLVLEQPKKEPRGESGRKCTIYALKPGVDLAHAPVYRSSRPAPREYDLRPVRAIEDAFHAIVHSRRIPPA